MVGALGTAPGMQVITVVTGKWRENCHVVSAPSGEAIVIDPGSEPEKISGAIHQNGYRVMAVVCTHAHHDHMGAVVPLQKEYGVSFYLHGADAALLRRANLYRMMFDAHDSVRVPAIDHDIAGLPSPFSVGPFSIGWIPTPGHTDGSICLLIENQLFSGDTLLCGAVGRTDLPGGNRERLLASLQSLGSLPPETIVHPGHGPATTIGAEFTAGAVAGGLLR